MPASILTRQIPSWIVLAILGASIVAIVVSLVIDGPPPVRYALDECPPEWERLPKELGGRVPPAGIAGVGHIKDIPEFHDCQPLLVDGGATYGPLTAVFAAEHLDSLDDSALVAAKLAGLAAVILNLGSQAYEPLDLKPGFTCLYLWRQQMPDKSSANWVAAHRWVEGDREGCVDRFPTADLDTTLLKVHRTEAVDVIPFVARWDWDAERGQQYIGVTCGRGWCDIGRRGTDPDEFSPQTAYSMSAEAPAVQRIKGWYDEQLLAIPDAKGVMRPSDVRGTVFPAPGSVVWADLAQKGDITSQADPWQDVAYIAIDRQSDHYKQMMNLDSVPRGSPLDRMNVMAFCFSTRFRCGVPAPPTTEKAKEMMSAGQPRLAPMASCGDGFAMVLWVRIRPAGDRSGASDMFRCAKRRAHEMKTPVVPATARWRWLVEDETVWRECTQGCCEVQVMDGG